MNNIFDKTRFWNTVKLDVATNWRGFSKPFFGALAGLFCTYMGFSMSLRYVEDHATFDSIMLGMTFASYFIFMCYMVFAGGLLFGNMKSKQRYITFLTLPASNLEKFLSRYLMVTVGMIVTFFAALLAADVARMIVGWLIGVKLFGSVFLHFFGFGWSFRPDASMAEILSELLGNRGVFVTNMALSLICSHAFYMLGSAFFRRRSILLTTLVVILWIIVQSVFGVGSFLQGFKAGMDHNTNFTIDNAGLVKDIIENVVVTVLCYWGAFKLFCRSQVINNKWFNL